MGTKQFVARNVQFLVVNMGFAGLRGYRWRLVVGGGWVAHETTAVFRLDSHVCSMISTDLIFFLNERFTVCTSNKTKILTNPPRNEYGEDGCTEM